MNRIKKIIRTNRILILLFLATLMNTQFLVAQSLNVSGKISSSDGQAVVGASVHVKGTSIGVTTDLDGRYEIKVPEQGNVLVYSFIGMDTEEVKADNAVINIVLRVIPNKLDELVVVGYSTQKRATLSGSVSSLSGKEVLKSPALNVTNSIAGTLPGLTVVVGGGEPGAEDINMYIRGQSSLNNSSPLVVVDGVPNRSLSRIDPATIESISVLKDASAAIYGSQAANGVILVTTKRGKSEKMQVTATMTAGYSSPTKIPKLTSAAQYAELVTEINSRNGGSGRKFTPEEIEKFANGTDPWRYPNTDWFDLVLKPRSLQTNANVSMSGGTEKLNAFVSASTRFQDGFFHNSASNYKQHDLRANVDSKINDYIKLSTDVSLRLEQRNFTISNTGTLFKNLMTADPTYHGVWPNGLPGPPIDIVTQANPVVQSTNEAGYDKGDRYVFNVNAKVDIKIPWVDGLMITGNAAIDRDLDYSKRFNKKYSLYSWDGTTVDKNNIPVLSAGWYGGSPTLNQQLSIYKRHLLSAIANYNKTFGDVHDINLLAGIETIEDSNNWFSAERRNFTAPFPEELDFGDVNSQYANGSNPGVNRWLNYFGRVNYTFNSKYIAEFVWRYQGSSKFGPKNRWGFFPGISVAYRISEEDFWKNSAIGDIVNNLKIRSSWGKTGNDLIDPYQFLSLYAKRLQPNFVDGSGVNYPTYYERKTANPSAQWEEADQFNVGFDANFFKNKLSITFDYFLNTRSKILIPQSASIPEFTGLTDKLPDVNLGKVKNQGFDFELAWNSKIEKFTYRIGLNGGYAKNKVLFFDEAVGVLPWQQQTGHPMHADIFYEAIGIFKDWDEVNKYPHMDEAQPGDIIFKDVNEDGEINGQDMVRIYKNIVPRFTAGLNLSAAYGGFDLSILFQGQAGAVRYVQPTGSSDHMNYLLSSYEGRWTAENPNASKPRIFDRNNEYWVSSENKNTFWLKKTDFIRLRNIELGYTLPTGLVQKVGLEYLRLNITGMNLFTYAPDYKDFDPESSIVNDIVGSGYPIQKIISIGLITKF